MSLHYGNKNITEVYYGSKKIKEIYKGSKLVFGGGLEPTPSYMILTDDTRIDFDLDNTPISNLSTPYDATSSITINGQSIIKNTIKEVHFGDSYKDVTSIGDFFLSGCTSLTSVDLSPLSNVTSIGDYFLIGCESLTSVDLSPLSNITSIGDFFLSGCTSLTSVDLSTLSDVTSIGAQFLSYCSGLTSVDLSTLSGVTSIGYYFLAGCSVLTTLIMGTETPPTLGSYAFDNANNLSLISVPCGSENDYKTATNWIAKADIIQGDCSLTPSYIILTDDTVIDFELDNTPIESFYADFDTQGYDEELEMPYLIYNINGDEVKSHKIKEICFGSSYNEITSIGDYFLAGCLSLTSVDLSPLSGVTSIGDGFLASCSSLATLIMGAETPPTLGNNTFGNSNNLSLILVPCGSENAYKTATNWINKASIIEGDC